MLSLKKRFPSLQSLGGDGNTSFLRAARAGNLERVLEHLKNNIDINTSNANGLNALHLASKDGHIHVVAELLKRGAIVDSATKKGNTALHIASLAGQEEVVQLLLQHNASVNVQSQNGFTPLYMAAQENHDSVVKLLLANGANQSLATEDGFTPLAVAMQQGHDKVVAVLLESDTRGKVRLPALHIAAKKDDVKAATLLLENDHNPDVTSKSGFTPLHIASHYGNQAIANLLIQKGADVNFSAKHNISPLHVAAKWGKTNMVSLLLEKGSNIEAKTRDGLTPLHCAARSGHEQVVDMLLERGAPISAKTKNGLAPLHMAAQGEHVDAARILLYHRAPVDEVTVDYLTALHVAAHCGHVRVAKLLLDRNADANARALNGFTPLHIACKKNRIKVVELLLRHGASISATTESGLTPLHVAAFMGCMNIVIYLLQHDASPDVPTVRGETPLHLAARANQTDIIRILLRNGAQVDARAREQQTPLHIASRLGNVDIVMLLLQHGAQVDATTKDMYTALHIAAKEGQDEVAAVLIENGAALDAATKKGFTPLHLTAKYGHIKVTQLLLQKDSDVDAQGKNGVTPLHVACHYDHQVVALLLLEKGASPHATAKNGHTPLHIAARKNQMDIATTLLEYGAQANAESKAGFTPLHLSSQEGHAEISNLLIEHKASVNHPAKNGLTPMHLCAQEDNVNVAEILERNGASTDMITKAGYTPLHVAAHFGQANMVRFLLHHGANVDAATAIGYTPLHQTAQQGHCHIVNLLLEHKANANAQTVNGQTPLHIARKLGYISVLDSLKSITNEEETSPVTQPDEKYRVVAPEAMHETFMSDSEEEGGEDNMLSDQPYRYLTVDEMKSLGDDSLPIDVTRDERIDSNRMTQSAEYGAGGVQQQPILEELISPHKAQIHGMGKNAVDGIYIGNGMQEEPHAGFLVSFLVDARGGAMRGCRHSGVRIIIPSRATSQPTRVTCRYVKPQRTMHPPQLMEGEALASRVLELGPVSTKFIGPVIMEVPHFASLRGKEREIIILRSDNGETWREHTIENSEDIIHDIMQQCFEPEEIAQLEEQAGSHVCRFVTYDFPQYFAVVSRIRQEVHAIGPEGGMVSSIVVPQVQAVFPQGALTKKIKVGLQAQPVDSDLTAKLLGRGVAVSPIVTVEPRRRKFHKAITLSMPAPKAHSQGMINQYSGNTPTLRLLCSITGGPSRAQWEDVTGSTPLTFVNDCVSFTTTVSARFWLMDCRNISEATKMATELYKEVIHVPFMAKFVVFAKKVEQHEARLRVFCMTDDKEDKTLEKQELFTEVAKSRDVEVLEGKPQYIEMAGNLVPVTKSGDQLQLQFKAFRENRLPFTVRVKDQHADIVGRTLFMKEPKVAKGEQPQHPICILNIVLPEVVIPDGTHTFSDKITSTYRTSLYGQSKHQNDHYIGDIRIVDLSNLLGKDWIHLGPEIGISSEEIDEIISQNTDSIARQAQSMIRLFKDKPNYDIHALEDALKTVGREDIMQKCKSGRLSHSHDFDEVDIMKNSESVEQLVREESKRIQQIHEREEVKYSAEEKEVEESESEEEITKRTVAERREKIVKRLSVERQVPASTQKKEIAREITEIKRKSLIEDKKAIHESEIMMQLPTDNIIKSAIVPEQVIKMKMGKMESTEVSKTDFDNELTKKFKASGRSSEEDDLIIEQKQVEYETENSKIIHDANATEKTTNEIKDKLTKNIVDSTEVISISQETKKLTEDFLNVEKQNQLSTGITVNEKFVEEFKEKSEVRKTAVDTVAEKIDGKQEHKSKKIVVEEMKDEIENRGAKVDIVTIKSTAEKFSDKVKDTHKEKSGEIGKEDIKEEIEQKKEIVESIDGSKETSGKIIKERAKLFETEINVKRDADNIKISSPIADSFEKTETEIMKVGKNQETPKEVNTVSNVLLDSALIAEAVGLRKLAEPAVIMTEALSKDVKIESTEKDLGEFDKSGSVPSTPDKHISLGSRLIEQTAQRSTAPSEETLKEQETKKRTNDDIEDIVADHRTKTVLVEKEQAHDELSDTFVVTERDTKETFQTISEKEQSQPSVDLIIDESQRQTSLKTTKDTCEITPAAIQSGSKMKKITEDFLSMEQKTQLPLNSGETETETVASCELSGVKGIGAAPDANETTTKITRKITETTKTTKFESQIPVSSVKVKRIPVVSSQHYQPKDVELPCAVSESKIMPTDAVTAISSKLHGLVPLTVDESSQITKSESLGIDKDGIDKMLSTQETRFNTDEEAQPQPSFASAKPKTVAVTSSELYGSEDLARPYEVTESTVTTKTTVAKLEQQTPVTIEKTETVIIGSSYLPKMESSPKFAVAMEIDHTDKILPIEAKKFTEDLINMERQTQLSITSVKTETVTVTSTAVPLTSTKTETVVCSKSPGLKDVELQSSVNEPKETEVTKLELERIEPSVITSTLHTVVTKDGMQPVEVKKLNAELVDTKQQVHLPAMELHIESFDLTAPLIPEPRKSLTEAEFYKSVEETINRKMSEGLIDMEDDIKSKDNADIPYSQTPPPTPIETLIQTGDTIHYPSEMKDLLADTVVTLHTTTESTPKKISGYSTIGVIKEIKEETTPSEQADLPDSEPDLRQGIVSVADDQSKEIIDDNVGDFDMIRKEASTFVDDVLEESINIAHEKRQQYRPEAVGHEILDANKQPLNDYNTSDSDNYAITCDDIDGLDVIKSPTIESMSGKSFDDNLSFTDEHLCLSSHGQLASATTSAVSTQEQVQIATGIPVATTITVVTDETVLPQLKAASIASLKELAILSGEDHNSIKSRRIDRKFEKLSSSCKDIDEQAHKFDEHFADIVPDDEISNLQGDFSNISCDNSVSPTTNTLADIGLNTPDNDSQDLTSETGGEFVKSIETTPIPITADNDISTPKPKPRSGKPASPVEFRTQYSTQEEDDSVSQASLSTPIPRPRVQLKQNDSFKNLAALADQGDSISLISLDITDELSKTEEVSTDNSIKSQRLDQHISTTTYSEEPVESFDPTSEISIDDGDTERSELVDGKATSFYIGESSRNIIIKTTPIKTDEQASENPFQELIEAKDITLMKEQSVDSDVAAEDESSDLSHTKIGSDRDEMILESKIIRQGSETRNDLLEQEPELQQLIVDKSKTETLDKKFRTDTADVSHDLGSLLDDRCENIKEVVHKETTEHVRPVDLDVVPLDKSELESLEKDFIKSANKVVHSPQQPIVKISSKEVEKTLDEVQQSLDAVNDELKQVLRDGKSIKESPSEFEFRTITTIPSTMEHAAKQEQLKVETVQSLDAREIISSLEKVDISSFIGIPDNVTETVHIARHHVEKCGESFEATITESLNKAAVMAHYGQEQSKESKSSLGFISHGTGEDSSMEGNIAREEHASLGFISSEKAEDFSLMEEYNQENLATASVVTETREESINVEKSTKMSDRIFHEFNPEQAMKTFDAVKLRVKTETPVDTTNRWSVPDVDHSSSSDSYYKSFDKSESHTISSDIKNLITQADSSEYQTALDASSVCREATEYASAVSAFDSSSGKSISSHESMKSLDSEISGNLGSIDVSELSETLVASSTDPDVLEAEEMADIHDLDDDDDSEESLEIAHAAYPLTEQQMQQSHMKRSQEMIFKPKTEDHQINEKVAAMHTTESFEIEEYPKPKETEKSWGLAYLNEIPKEELEKADDILLYHSDNYRSIEDAVKLASSLDEGSILSVSMSSTSNLDTVVENFDDLIGSAGSSSLTGIEGLGLIQDDKLSFQWEETFEIELEGKDQSPQEVTTTTPPDDNKRRGHKRNESTAITSEELKDITEKETPILGEGKESGSESDTDPYESEYARQFRSPKDRKSKKKKQAAAEMDHSFETEKRPFTPSQLVAEIIVEDIITEELEAKTSVIEESRPSQNKQNYSKIPDITVTEETQNSPLIEEEDDKFPEKALYKVRTQEELHKATDLPLHQKTKEDESFQHRVQEQYMQKLAELKRSEIGADSDYDENKAPDSPDSFEMVDQPDISEEFVIIEEVAKEANEVELGGQSIKIKSTKYESKHDEEVEKMIIKSAPADPKLGSQLYRDDLNFEFEESPPTAESGTGSGSENLDEASDIAAANKKWVEMQLTDAQLRYPYDLTGGILEDIKEEDGEFEVGSSRISSFKDSFSSTPEYDVLAGRRYFARGEHDDISMSSLQEFESLEQAISLENRNKTHQGSTDSSNGSFTRRYLVRHSGSGVAGAGDDISLSSLKEFEGLENACIEAHLTEVKAKEEAALLLSRSDESSRSNGSDGGNVAINTSTTRLTRSEQVSPGQNIAEVKQKLSECGQPTSTQEHSAKQSLDPKINKRFEIVTSSSDISKGDNLTNTSTTTITEGVSGEHAVKQLITTTSICSGGGELVLPTEELPKDSSFDSLNMYSSVEQNTSSAGTTATYQTSAGNSQMSGSVTSCASSTLMEDSFNSAAMTGSTITSSYWSHDEATIVSGGQRSELGELNLSETELKKKSDEQQGEATQ